MRFYSYIAPSGNIGTAQAKGYILSFVKAPKEGIITNNAHDKFHAFKVIKSDGSERVVNERIEGQPYKMIYTYEEGDEFVYIGLRDKSIDNFSDVDAIAHIAENVGAYRGTEMPPKFVPYGITKECQDKIDGIGSFDARFDEIENTVDGNKDYIKKNVFINSEYAKYFKELYITGLDITKTYIVQYLNGNYDIASGTGVVVRISQSDNLDNYGQITYIRGNGIQYGERNGIGIYLLMQCEDEITTVSINNNTDATKHVVSIEHVTNIQYSSSIYKFISKVNTSNIEDDAVTNPKLMDKAVSLQKIEDSVLNLPNIGNGYKSILENTASDITPRDNYIASTYDEETGIRTITSRTRNDTNWLYYPNMGINQGNIVKIRFKVRRNDNTALTDNTNRFRLYVSDGRGTYESDYVPKLEDIFVTNHNWKDVVLSFDPAWYEVYKGFSPNGIWFMITMKDYETVWEIKDLEIYQTIGETSYQNIQGSNAAELFADIDNKIANINQPTSNDGFILHSPDNTMYVLQVSNNGTLLSIPICPDKSAFFGNSLIGSWGFGMAASDANHDYYHLITTYIKSVNPNATFARYTSANGTITFENAETISDARTAINTLINNLTGDEQLISIQLGDNVNTAAKTETFSTSCKELILAMRNKCPNARIIWVAMWYSTAEKMAIVQKACKETGTVLINIVSLRNSNTENAIGGTTTRGYSATSTVENVTSVVKVSTGRITVNFTVNNVSYQSTIDVASYSLDGTTLTYTGYDYIITQAGVASHPSDEGMRLIANKFLHDAGFVITEEYYTNS